ncbi:MAG: zinc ribbon domain-containing protein [Planctomycetes bacterium]|nr:zinc ribbon domain-containing protein [Planctomycetota bacterium]
MSYEEDKTDDRDDDFDDDDFDDDEFEEGSGDDDDSFDTVPCPYCRQPIHEDAVRCPHCENYISTVDAPRFTFRPWWIILGVVVCLAIVYVWVTGGW